MLNKIFWADAAERAVKTAAQAALGVFVAGVTIMSVNWAEAAAIAGTAALVSILTSIASSGVRHQESGSLLHQTPATPIEGEPPHGGS